MQSRFDEECLKGISSEYNQYIGEEMKIMSHLMLTQQFDDEGATFPYEECLPEVRAFIERLIKKDPYSLDQIINLIDAHTDEGGNCGDVLMNLRSFSIQRLNEEFGDAVIPE